MDEHHLPVTESIHFPNAPITEALLDIRAVLPLECKINDLDKFQHDIRDQYPLKRDRITGSLNIRLKDPKTPVIERSIQPAGFFYASSDQRRVVQVRLDGFTFSWMKPYDRWETFRDEARRLWKHYVRVACPSSISRVALRYINRIELPFEEHQSLDFDEFLLTGAEIAPGLPQELSHFFVRFVLVETRLPAMAVVTQTLENVDEAKRVVPLIFDIDVFREFSFACDGEEVWMFFEQLRHLKNTIFLNSLTEKTKDLFK